MKRTITLLPCLLCVLVLAFFLSLLQYCPHACADSIVALESIRIDADDPVREYMLQATEYVSEDEIWFSGSSDGQGPWIVKANAYGTVLWQTTLPTQGDERVIVYDMKKGPNGLLLGTVDGRTTLGRVVLLAEDGQIYETSLGNGKIFSYHACPLGILAQGILYDDVKETCAPQTTLVGMDGKIIFQYTGMPYETAVDQGALTSSICCASDDSIFIVEVKMADNGFQLEHEVVSLDTAGKEKWRIALEGDMSIEDISVSDGNIYLVGFSIIRNNEGMPVSRSSMIRCYSDQGVERWQRQFDLPSAFYDCDAIEDTCIATSPENGIWYIVVLDRDGQIQSTASIEADEQYINQSCIISNDRLIILGEMQDYLLIHSFSY